MTYRKCTRCEIIKPLEDFFKHKKCLDGYNSQCKDCTTSANKAWREKNKDKMDEYRRRNIEKNGEIYRDRFLQRTYGITKEVYQSMVDEQGGNCFICQSDNQGKRLHIDHCHKHGHVRRLLCTKCNTALGLVDDKISTLKSMINYLESH